MSCGNRFQCGLSKPSRFQFQPDKPSNPELHTENQKRLNDLLRAREDMDKAFTAPSNAQSQDKPQQSLQQFNELEPTNTDYTPWKTPTAEIFQKK
jgi:hypothetical protein